MKIDKLVRACERFEKLAQKIVLDPKKSNVGFYSKFLYNAVGSYAKLFPTPEAAQAIYNAIAKHNTHLSMGSEAELRQVQQVQAAIGEAASHLQQAGLNPVDALKKMGMQNVHPDILNVLQSNLQIMVNAKQGGNLSALGYRHYSLPVAGQLEYIDLDQWEANRGPGY